VGGGVIGNFAYDLLKQLFVTTVEKLKQTNAMPFLVSPEKTDDENLKLLIELTKTYIEYKKSPFHPKSDIGKVFAVIESSEPGEFLNPSQIKRLENIYRDNQQNDISSDITATDEVVIDLVKYWNAILLREYEKSALMHFLSGEYQKGASQVMDEPTNENLLWNQLGSYSSWIYNSEFVYHELIENALLALQNTANPRLLINIAKDSFFIDDNGPGITPEILFKSMLLPSHKSAWVQSGILKKDQSWERRGLGFLTCLRWCRRIIVETIPKEERATKIEISIDNPQKIQLRIFPHNFTNKFQTGTRVSGELSQFDWWSRGGNSKKVYSDDEYLFILKTIRSYCKCIDENIPVYLNGKRVNIKGIRGIGPMQFIFTFPEKTTQHLIQFYVIPISSNEDDVVYKSEFKVDDRDKIETAFLFEFYENGLLLFERDYGNVQNFLAEISQYSEKIANITPSEKRLLVERLQTFMIRVFLSPDFPLLIGKRDGLLSRSENYIKAQVIDLIFDEIFSQDKPG
jgi:hypothetical protein